MRAWVGVVTVLVVGCGMLSACSGSAPDPTHDETPSTVATEAGSPADRLAGLVAAAVDRHYIDTYAYTPSGRHKRTVTVTLAADGSWRVDVPDGALGGGQDVAVAGTPHGIYQCKLGDDASCAKVAGSHGSVPAKYDPRIERLFVQWLPKLGDRNAALSVATAPRPKGVTGSCFSVEPTAASLSSPVPSGVYCLAADGSVTGAKLGLGTLVRLSAPAPAPSTIKLPGPTSDGAAVATTSPSPSPSATSSGSTSPRPDPSDGADD